MWKKLNGTIQTINLISARQKDAINALVKPQCYGVTDEEIVNIYRFFESARLENSRRITHGPLDSQLFKSGEKKEEKLVRSFVEYLCQQTQRTRIQIIPIHDVITTGRVTECFQSWDYQRKR